MSILFPRGELWRGKVPINNFDVLAKDSACLQEVAHVGGALTHQLVGFADDLLLVLFALQGEENTGERISKELMLASRLHRTERQNTERAHASQWHTRHTGSTRRRRFEMQLKHLVLVELNEPRLAAGVHDHNRLDHGCEQESDKKRKSRGRDLKVRHSPPRKNEGVHLARGADEW